MYDPHMYMCIYYMHVCMGFGTHTPAHNLYMYTHTYIDTHKRIKHTYIHEMVARQHFQVSQAK